MDEEQRLKSCPDNISEPEVKKLLEELIRNDDKEGFVYFLQSKSKLEDDNSSFSAGDIKNMVHCDCGDIMMWICSHSAEGCATALLEGETGLYVDLNVPLRSGCYPLHHVAENLCSRLTDLFLCHGARADLPCAAKDSNYFGMLPLGIALEALRSHNYLSDWDPSKSIFKLIYCLCLPQLHQPLETVKLLSERTQELEKITSSIVREGKLVELAGLLFVAWDKLLVPISGDNVDSSAIGQCIKEILVSLIDQEYKLINTGRNIALSECRKMQDVMASASLMLTVFERSGEIFDIFRLLCFHYRFYYRSFDLNYLWARNAIMILKQLGFDLKREDTNLSDMLCFHIGMNPSHAEELCCSIDKILLSRQLQVSSASSFDGSRKQKDLVSNNLAVNHDLVQPPSSRGFHTCRIPMSSSIGPRLCTPAEAHRMNTISSTQSNVVSGMQRGANYGLTLMRLKDKMRLVTKLI